MTRCDLVGFHCLANDFEEFFGETINENYMLDKILEHSESYSVGDTFSFDLILIEKGISLTFFVDEDDDFGEIVVYLGCVALETVATKPSEYFEIYSKKKLV